MNTLTIRDLRSRPRFFQQLLAEGGDALLTNNGRPVALMVPVTAGTLDETVTSLRRARALRALALAREHAKARGLNRLTMAEIDDEIGKARRAKTAARRAR